MYVVCTWCPGLFMLGKMALGEGFWGYGFSLFKGFRFCVQGFSASVPDFLRDKMSSGSTSKSPLNPKPNLLHSKPKPEALHP